MKLYLKSVAAYGMTQIDVVIGGGFTVEIALAKMSFMSHMSHFQLFLVIDHFSSFEKLQV
jgi:hypothetical protein